MVGKFDFDTPLWRASVDSYLNALFGHRCGGMEAVVRDTTGDVSGCNQLVFVVAQDAADQYDAIKHNAPYTEDFTTFRFVNNYLKSHSGLRYMCGVVINEDRNISVVYFDGNTEEFSARALIGAAPAYFRYLFLETPLSAYESRLAVNFANPEKDVGFGNAYRNMTTVEVPPDMVVGGRVSITKLLTLVGLACTGAEAKRLVYGGAIRVNTERITSIDTLVPLDASGIILRKGKKTLRRVVVKR